MFKRGARGNPVGRMSGATRTRVRLMRELAEMIVTDPEVQAKLFEQARTGKLPPRLMLELFRFTAASPQSASRSPPRTRTTLSTSPDSGSSARKISAH